MKPTIFNIDIKNTKKENIQTTCNAIILNLFSVILSN